MPSIIEYLIVATLRMGTPIALTSVGACLSERSGIPNIGLEGIMSMGAFLAVVGSYWTGSPWIGILMAIICGIMISVIHGFVTITCGGAPPVSAQALVLLATGFCSVGLQAVFNRYGFSDNVASIPNTPILAHIPVVGRYLADISPIVYLAFLLLFVVNHLLYKTPLGLRIQACGEHPKAADTAGINVNALRYFSVIVSGALGGLGGAFLSIGTMNMFQEGMVAGRGYLAVGAVIMGRWSPKGAFWAAMCFGFFDALQLYLQILPNSPVPSQFVQMIPYVASLIMLTVTIKGATAPAASGKSYSVVAGTK